MLLPEVHLHKPKIANQLLIPLVYLPVHCGFTGFQSPADDYIETALDLNAYMNVKGTSTFFVKATGQSMIDAGIDEKDILVVDRSLLPEDGRIAVCTINERRVVKRIQKSKGKLYLVSANPQFQPIEIKEEDELLIWGIVRGVVKKLV